MYVHANMSVRLGSAISTIFKDTERCQKGGRGGGGIRGCNPFYLFIFLQKEYGIHKHTISVCVSWGLSNKNRLWPIYGEGLTLKNISKGTDVATVWDEGGLHLLNSHPPSIQRLLYIDYL